ncbi:MAG TPA: HAMP domain-containing sensor histidine kinase [Candidatus Eisenbacteria bacterium]|nr:HAMP domain-containing sensor histidine kinase [Candidatus Eisenbacteria bacterium]
MLGIRTRLAATLVALVAVTVLAIGVGTYAFVDARLREGLLADATRQAQFNLSVLLPPRLAELTDREQFEAGDLPAAIGLRGDVETIVDFGDGDPYASTLSLQGALTALPAALKSSVDSGRLGYAWLTLAGQPVLVVGGRPAGGPAVYFVFAADSIEQALGQLRLGLAAAALIAIVLALATAGLIAGRILRPVRSGRVAAARIAAGDLSARVPAEGRDEFARWAAEFNRMADSLEGTIDRLETAQGQNRRFVAEVSHELRTPLTALVAEASIIEAGLDGLPPDARRAAELLVADVRRIRVLVDELMELSRFDAAAEEVQLEAVDLGRVVSSIVANRLPAARVSLPPEPVIVASDVRRLDRILGNLLDNARIHASGTPVDVTVRPAGDVAEIVVADRGPGVPAEALPRLFDRFYKGDRSRSTGTSGLGLAIAAEHAALLGGSLRAGVRPGGGLAVRLALPVTGSLPGGDLADTGVAERSTVPDTMSVSSHPPRPNG